MLADLGDQIARHLAVALIVAPRDTDQRCVVAIGAVLLFIRPQLLQQLPDRRIGSPGMRELLQCRQLARPGIGSSRGHIGIHVPSQYADRRLDIVDFEQPLAKLL